MKTYQPKIAKYYIIGSIVSVLLCCFYFFIVEGKPGDKNIIFFKLLFIAIAIMALPYKAFLEKYILENNFLTIKGLFPSKIDINKIKSVNRIIYSGRSFPTTSTDCLEIKYGFSNTTYVAPIDMEGFANDLLLVNPNIEVNVNPVDKASHKVRVRILGLTIISLILAYVLFVIAIPTYITQEKDMVVVKDFIAYSFTNTYNTGGRHSVKKHSVDIVLYNSEKTLRITENNSKYWERLLDTSKYQKAIKFKVYPWRADNDLIYDPSPLIIDSVTIIPFEKDTNSQLSLVVALSVILAFILLILFNKIKAYRKKAFYEDKVTYSEGLWKLVGQWLKN